MRTLILLALVLNCATPARKPPRDSGYHPFSPCGARVVGSSDHAGYAAAEAAIMEALEKHHPGACANLAGWVVIVNPAADASGGWVYERTGQRVRGLTSCRDLTIEIGSAVWWQSALAHEFIHAAVECPWSNVKHEGWEEGWKAGFYSEVAWPP